jgi:hypothetical protein
MVRKGHKNRDGIAKMKSESFQNPKQHSKVEYYSPGGVDAEPGLGHGRGEPAARRVHRGPRAGRSGRAVRREQRSVPQRPLVRDTAAAMCEERCVVRVKCHRVDNQAGERMQPS